MVKLLSDLKDELFVIQITFDMADFRHQAEKCDAGGGNEERCNFFSGVVEDVEIEGDHGSHGGTLDEVEADGKLEVVADLLEGGGEADVYFSIVDSDLHERYGFSLVVYQM